MEEPRDEDVPDINENSLEFEAELKTMTLSVRKRSKHDREWKGLDLIVPQSIIALSTVDNVSVTITTTAKTFHYTSTRLKFDPAQLHRAYEKLMRSVLKSE